MKQFKFLSVILLFLLSFVSREEFNKYVFGGEKFKSENNFISAKIQLVSTLTLKYLKDADVHLKIKKKIKYRATASENSTLNTPYLTKLIRFKFSKNRLSYGVVSVYQIQRHTYLHLYHFF
ncbi:MULTISPECIES: hypothetical protein [Flavobacterium]|jgi:hypothetical protein|uniref:Uncharacterized protein n=2 Tax=Flavobacterium TaxID=237 RepID=A0A1S1J8R8_9FLAO|nr:MULTISPECIES: hypothetical protein [Flavobacterium]MCC9020512.1 hypothetical protein [Flavobacterium sp. F-126]MDL2145490.1 hypothetical protein [Flavobacterium tructae]OHT47062.1 hypothetical protein BHE19_21755 [Flavobacterium tructae]OXB15751.1 hypothetical protein B0A71_20235 [Flavobacterium tructae]